MADTYSIVDEHGIKHNFPKGFDPIQAAKIVRKNAQSGDEGLLSKFVNWAVEPSRLGTAIQTRDAQMANLIEGTDRTPVHARITDVVKDAPGIISDLASGIVHHPVETLRGGAAGVMQGIGDVTSGMSSPAGLVAAASGPLGRVAKAAPAVAPLIRLATRGANAAFATKGAEEVVNAPDLEGKLMGLSQIAMGGKGLAEDPGVVAGARKAATTTGELMTKAADNAAIRNTLRASAIGAAGAGATGHPIVASVLAPLTIAPEAMRFSGQKLIRFGQGTSGVVPNLAGSIGAHEPAPMREPAPGREPLPRGFEGLIDYNSTPPSQFGVGATGVPHGAAVPAELLLRDLARMTPEARRAELANRAAARGQGPADRSAFDAEGGAVERPEIPTVGKMEDALATPMPPEEAAPVRTARDVYREQGRPIESLPTNEGIPEEFQQSQYGDLPRRSNPAQDQLFGRERIEGPDTSDAAFEARARGEYVAGDEPGFEQQLRDLERGTPSQFTAEGSGQLDPITGNVRSTDVGDVAQAGPAIGELPPKQLTGDVETPKVSSEAQYDPANPPPGPSAGGSTGIEPQTFEEAMAAAMNPEVGKPAAPVAPPISMTEPTVVPDTDPRVAAPVPAEAMPAAIEKPRVRVTASGEAVPKGVYTHPVTGEEMHPLGSVFEPSRSRRGKAQMSATPGYTKADMAAMGLPDTVKHTHITKAQAAAGKAARLARTQKYYQAALEDKAARDAGLDAGAP